MSAAVSRFNDELLDMNAFIKIDVSSPDEATVKQ